MGFTRVSEYFQPESGPQVVELLGQYGDRARILAGGTLLHGLAARGLLPNINILIDLQKVGLSCVKAEAGTLIIGAMTTFTELAGTDQVRSMPELGAVKDALHYPPSQISNLATVGGSIASASPLFDVPVAFMALEGSVRALGPDGPKQIELRNFFVDYFEHVLAADEFLTEVLLPKLPPRSASAFLKLETNANDLALLNVGVRVTLDDSGTCSYVCVVVGGGVGKTPVRAVSCEDVLKGKQPNRALLDEAVDTVAFDVHPISDHRGSARYRTAVAKVYVRRALTRAFARVALELS